MSNVSWTQFARLVGAPVTVTLRGRVASADEPAERVCFAPPDLWRVTDDDGHLRYLANDDGHYTYPPGETRACFQPRRKGFWHSGGTVCSALIHPRDLDDADDDFTRPLGAVEEIAFLGRVAWRVLLAPPARKPQPVWQVLDVASGVTLAYQAPDGQPLVAFTALETDVALPDGTFAA
ncbi:hypothetical protein ACQP2F_25350 [Actinoplanes sp. CA-030573]|uniref:hypothetical protein n=1 Tax=Actinoplanes sp. CA-030573 TaxID=3239898 RepID=UPI003D92BB50